MQTILIIEDDAALASGLCRALKREDRTLQSCGKLREARRFLREVQPDLIILDVNLPDGSGFDFLGEIKGKGAVPVILLTANDMETDIVAGLEAGAGKRRRKAGRRPGGNPADTSFSLTGWSIWWREPRWN